MISCWYTAGGAAMAWKAWFEKHVLGVKSWEAIEQANRSSGRAVSRETAYALITNHRIFAHPAAVHQRAMVVELLAHPLDQTGRAALDRLLNEALVAQGFLKRPETIDEIWHLEGLFDRMLQPE
jgi:hypothetical protein